VPGVCERDITDDGTRRPLEIGCCMVAFFWQPVSLETWWQILISTSHHVKFCFICVKAISKSVSCALNSVHPVWHWQMLINIIIYRGRPAPVWFVTRLRKNSENHCVFCNNETFLSFRKVPVSFFSRNTNKNHQAMVIKRRSTTTLKTVLYVAEVMDSSTTVNHDHL